MASPWDSQVLTRDLSTCSGSSECCRFARSVATYPKHSQYDFLTPDEVFPYLVLSQHISHVLAFDGQGVVLTLGVGIFLRDRIVDDILCLDIGIGYFFVGVGLSLEVLLLFDIIVQFILPLGITITR